MTVLPVTPSASEPAAAYEKLRQHVVSQSCGSHFGLCLVHREGLAAWMARGVTPIVPSFPALAPTPAPVLPDEIQASFVQVLASMALAGRQQQEMLP